MSAHWTPPEQVGVEHMLRQAIVGGPEAVRTGLEHFVADTAADEIIITANIHDHDARLRSYEIVADVAGVVSHAATGPTAVTRPTASIG